MFLNPESILLPKIVLTFHYLNKLFCSIDQEKLLKLKAEGQEFAKLAGQNNFGNQIP